MLYSQKFLNTGHDNYKKFKGRAITFLISLK